MFEAQKVLTIDDSPTIRQFLRTILEAQGATVEEAGTGQGGLDQCARGQRYTLILLDLALPDMDGLQVLKHLREEDTETTIAMLTGGGGIKTAMEAVRHGADTYVEKQDLVASGDYTGFLYTLEQATKQRAGLVAQKRLQQIKADFYSMVTHDLRNPASSILVMTEILQKSQPQTFSADQHYLLNLIEQAAHQLMGLIDNYLDFSKIDAGYLRLEYHAAELRELIASRVRLMAPQARARKQTLTLGLPEAPIRALVDAERLGQAVDNLLSNALKYSPEGALIAAHVAMDENSFVFRVSDTGPGIAPEQLPALFTKYHRVPGPAARGIRGSGLGLLIVKEIVEAHGGSVTAESQGRPGSGATFTIRIPLKSSQPEPPVSSPR